MTRNRKTRLVSALLLLALLVGAALPLPALAQEAAESPDGTQLSAVPDWLEPRGLNVLDMVGQAPEDHLRGSILVFNEAGVTQYLSGRRDGDKVTIEVSISSFESPLFTEIPCLGRRPLFDEWPVPVPPSTMRIFSGGTEITAQAIPNLWYFPAEQEQPIQGSRPSGGPAERYFEDRNAMVSRTDDGALALPANMGCRLFFWGSIPDLTATFVFDYPQQVTVEPLGSQTFTVRSYVGPGEAGRLKSLSDQLRSTYPNRHEKFRVNAPAGADYVWLNYPPSPVSAYTSSTSKLEHNIRLPSSGTYRLIGFGDTKSVDHVVSMGLPLHAQWIDADLRGGDWLHRTAPIELVSAPEYFVPPGVPYDPCMKDGGCSEQLLETIWNTKAEMTLHYYRVRRVRGANLNRVPLRAVGPSWDSAAAQDAHMAATDSPGTTVLPESGMLWLPLVHASLVPPTFPDDVPEEGCPCGWFDEYYRMLDVIPGL